MIKRSSMGLTFTVIAGLVLAGSGVSGLAAVGAPAMAPAAQMMGPGQQMPMAPTTGQMQQQMNQMTTNLRAMRAQLDKVNPDLLTAQQRPMYEYLKLLQKQMESMHGMMGMMQGAIGQMPAMNR
jgi:hypothetical protein